MKGLGLRDPEEQVVLGRVAAGEVLRVPGDDGTVHIGAHRGAVRRGLDLGNWGKYKN